MPLSLMASICAREGGKKGSKSSISSSNECISCPSNSFQKITSNSCTKMTHSYTAHIEGEHSHTDHSCKITHIFNKTNNHMYKYLKQKKLWNLQPRLVSIPQRTAHYTRRRNNSHFSPAFVSLSCTAHRVINPHQSAQLVHTEHISRQNPSTQLTSHPRGRKMHFAHKSYPNKKVKKKKKKNCTNKPSSCC